MQYLTEPVSANAAVPTDFMRRSYELNGEPLRLVDAGQRWLTRCLLHECEGQQRTALLLGATPWLAQLLNRTAGVTVVADMSAAMLNMCADSVCSDSTRPPDNIIEFVQGNWLSLPTDVARLDLVVGDNAFSFLRYPIEWDQMLAMLADRMAQGGVLFARLLAIPPEHRSLKPADIISTQLERLSPINFTAIRTALLFSEWEAVDYTIRPENALKTFERHRDEFAPLLSDGTSVDGNDLISIVKYRGANATYFVPPFAAAVATFRRHFHVRAVHFGPYEMSDYFPLIVAAKR